MKIYLDIFYLVNFFLNLFVFEILNIFLKKKPVSIRTICAATVGATFAVLIIVCRWKTHIGIFLVMYGLVISLMIRIAYGKTSFQGLLRYVAGFYLTAFFLAGAILHIRGLVGMKNVSLIFLLITAIILVCVIRKIHSSIQQEVTRSKGIFSVRIMYNGKRITGTAFLDTGNHLCEPISQEPVSIIEYRLFRHMLSEKERADWDQTIHNMEPELFAKLLLRYIPVHSLGTDKNYILGVRVDDMEVQVNGQKAIHTGKTWLGICDGFLSTDKEYDVLLNGKIFSE